MFGLDPSKSGVASRVCLRMKHRLIGDE